MQAHPLILVHTSPIFHSTASFSLSLLHSTHSHLTLPSLSISPFPPLPPPPPPPSQSGPSLVSMVTVREALLRAENCSWLPFRAAAAEALFSALLWMVWGSGRGERRTGGTHPSFFEGGGQSVTLYVCRWWGEEEKEEEEQGGKRRREWDE